MLDCRRVEHFRLRFPNREHADLVLGPGVHGIGRDGAAAVVPPNAAADASAQLCVDRRGVWLRLVDGAHAVHVNGRHVRRMAMLRVGDAIYLDGVEMLLLSTEDVQRRIPGVREAASNEATTRIVLRGVGGQHHGRCFSLEQPRVVGRLADCDIRVDDPAFADRHARLELHGDGVALRGLAAEDTSIVNGEAVRDALLRPGDQIVFDAHHRFVLEAPGWARVKLESPVPPDEPEAALPFDGLAAQALPASTRRLPWLLLAALLIAAALSGLLLFGVV